MKVIKFRAWDGTQMIENAFGRSLRAIACADLLKGSDVYVPTGYEIMQFSGLYDDANAEEIYEGDIIEGSFLGEKFVGQMDFLAPSFRLRVPSKFSSLGYTHVDFGALDVATPRRIIGNIYENPELLT